MQDPLADLPAAFRARPVSLPGDLPALIHLQNADRAGNGSPFRVSEGDLVEELTAPGVEVERDTRVVEDPSGALVASLFLDPALGRDGDKVLLDIAFDPAQTDGPVADPLVAWGIAAARARIAAEAVGPAGIEVAGRPVDPVTPAARATHALLARHGFRAVRWFATLRLTFADRPAAPDPDAVPLPAGYRVVPVPIADPRVAQLHSEAFRDHWGHFAWTPGEWAHSVSGESSRPGWSEVVADADGRLVAYLLSAEYAQDHATLGRVAWVDALGTLRPDRGKGLASALLERALARYAAAGMDGAMLGVDGESPTGADRLYARLGFRPHQRTIRFRIDVPGPAGAAGTTTEG